MFCKHLHHWQHASVKLVLTPLFFYTYPERLARPGNGFEGAIEPTRQEEAWRDETWWHRSKEEGVEEQVWAAADPTQARWAAPDLSNII